VKHGWIHAGRCNSARATYCLNSRAASLAWRMIVRAHSTSALGRAATLKLPGVVPQRRCQTVTPSRLIQAPFSASQPLSQCTEPSGAVRERTGAAACPHLEYIPLLRKYPATHIDCVYGGGVHRVGAKTGVCCCMVSSGLAAACSSTQTSGYSVDKMDGGVVAFVAERQAEVKEWAWWAPAMVSRDAPFRALKLIRRQLGCGTGEGLLYRRRMLVQTVGDIHFGLNASTAAKAMHVHESAIC
jgi:hypothetical protein